MPQPMCGQVAGCGLVAWVRVAPMVIEAVDLARVVDGESATTVGYAMEVGGGQYEALVLVGIHEGRIPAIRRVLEAVSIKRRAEGMAASFMAPPTPSIAGGTGEGRAEGTHTGGPR